MIFLDFYKEKLNCITEDMVFNYLVENLQESISDWNFFVDWKKIKSNINEIETQLNILNTLIGKEDIEDRFINILTKYPEAKSVLPILIAIRNTKLKEMPILNNKNNLDLELKSYLFDKDKNITDKTKTELIRFFNESGLKNILLDKSIKNLVDYCFGVEVGMDTNARKNRGGDNMENIVEPFINNFCYKNGYKYLRQANAEKIKREWGYKVPVDRSSRRYDFVVNNGKELIVFEANFYGGGGSKLKSTASEYKKLFDILKGKYKFVWITDGAGWKTTKNPLRESFNYIDYIFNLNLLRRDILDKIY